MLSHTKFQDVDTIIRRCEGLPFLVPVLPFFKNGVVKNLANFTEKHLYWSLFLIKLQIWISATSLKRLQYRCFPVKFAKFLRAPFFTETFGGCFWISTKISLNQRWQGWPVNIQNGYLHWGPHWGMNHTVLKNNHHSTKLTCLLL